MCGEPTVRTGTVADLPAVRTVLDGALLQVEDGQLRRAIAADSLLVATSEAGTILGALVLDGREIRAVAVRRRRRGQGIGTALVERAAREGPLRAAFDRRVAPFWRSLGFDIESLGDDRFLGRR